MSETDRLTRVEERYAHLQRHLAEQDKAVLELAEEVRRLRRELAGLRARVAAAPDGEELPGDERPPHY